MFRAEFTSLRRHPCLVEQPLHQAGMHPVQGPPVAAAEYLEVHLDSPESAEQEDSDSDVMNPRQVFSDENSREPKVLNSLPCCPAVADGGVTFLLISVVHHQIRGLADVKVGGCCHKTRMSHVTVLANNNGVGSQRRCQTGRAYACLRYLGSDCPGVQYLVPGGAVEPNVTVLTCSQ